MGFLPVNKGYFRMKDDFKSGSPAGHGLFLKKAQ